MNKLISELQRRNVIKAAISYLVLAYALIEASSILFPILKLDSGYNRVLLIILAVLFPCWLVFAYIYEWTPDGFKKTDEVPEEKSLYKTTERKLNHAIIAGLSVVIVLLVVDRVFHVSEDMITTTPETSTIAILPFTNQSEGSADEFFSSGIHDDVMIKLSRIKDFRIISKSLVSEYKDYEGDMADLGKRLNASFIMQGTVRRWENEIRITCQLIEAKSNQIIWSDEYEGDLSNVFVTQNNIASQIATKLEANLSQTEQEEILKFPTENLAAYDEYLKAKFLLETPRYTYDDLEKSKTMVMKALALDKNFTRAWALLIEINSERYNRLSKIEGQEAEAQLAKNETEEALASARQLSPSDWEILVEEGFYHFYIANDPITALSYFVKAVERNPSDVTSLIELGKIYMALGDIDKSIQAGEQAFSVNPTNGLISQQLSLFYEMRGDYYKLIPLIKGLAENYPDEKHYLVEAKYFEFMRSGQLSDFEAFEKMINSVETEFPWDERAIKNKEMVVAMFNNEFIDYHSKWEGNYAAHTNNGHGGWVCPMVANDNINHARVMLEKGDPKEAQQMITRVGEIVLKPINRNSVCVFDPEVYLPKLDYLKGNKELAKEKLVAVTPRILNNTSFPTAGVERSVLLQAADLISPESVFQYYELIVKNSVSFSTFESICADPWTYPNLINDPKFIAEIMSDGRFVEFLKSFGFLKS